MEETYKHGFLSEEKEKELAIKIKEGDQVARERLINTHLKMVFTIAKKFNKSKVIPLEDLIQEGNLGLVAAADNFDHTKEVRFASYAKWWIAEFIKRKFYKELYMVSTPFRIVKKSFQVSIEGSTDLEETKKGENQAINNMLQKPLYLSDSINNQSGDMASMKISDTIKDNRDLPEEKYERNDLKNHLEKRVKYYLTKEESYIITQRYLSGRPKLTYKNLGGELNVSSETVRNIEKRAMQKLRKKLKNDLSFM